MFALRSDWRLGRGAVARVLGWIGVGRCTVALAGRSGYLPHRWLRSGAPARGRSMAAPLRKVEIETLERVARGQPDSATTDEMVLARLVSLGLIEQRHGRYGATQRGTMELTRRKALLRTHSAR
jgi:hypothetical protein